MTIKYKDQSFGQNGISPTVEVTEIEGGHQVKITDADGNKTFNVMNGVNGTSDLPVIKNAIIDNISAFDGISLPSCIHFINASLGYTFLNDIIYVAKSDDELTATTIDNVNVRFKVESNGELTLLGVNRLNIKIETLETDVETLKQVGGKPGLSAYEVAAENGFEGTVEEWLSSLVGQKGAKGDPGQPFSIAKTYGSIIGMDGDYDNQEVAIGQFVMINSDDVDDPDNAKLFLKTETGFLYIADLSGATGIRGLTGKSAYDIAVDEGFGGTEEEWLESLIGPAGQNGTSPTVEVTEIEGGHRVSITDASSTKTFDVMNGVGESVTPENVNWEDINGRPDLSNVSEQRRVDVTLYADGWSDGHTQEVSIPEILADVKKQLIIPMPAEGMEDVCNTFGVKPLSQSAGHLSFVAETTPDVDVEIVVFIFEAVSVEGSEPEGEVTA